MTNIYYWTIFVFLVLSFFLWYDFFWSNGISIVVDKMIFDISRPSIQSDIFFYPITDILDIFWNIILGSNIYNKVFFLSIFFVYGFLGYEIYQITNQNKSDNFILICISILFFLFYPFFYQRILTQPWIAWAIWLIWIWMTYLIRQRMIWAIVFFGIATSIMPHSVFFILIVWIWYILFFYQNINIKKVSLGSIVFLAINITRIASIFLGQNKQFDQNLIQNMDQKHIEVFSTNSLDIFGPTWTSILGYGFWIERHTDGYRYFFLPQEIHTWRFYFSFVILFFVLHWFYILVKDQNTKKIWLFLIFCSVWSLFLWIWVSWYFDGMFYRIYEHIPLYIGMREPQKWIGIYMICSWFAFLVSMDFLYTHLIKKQNWQIGFFVFICLCFWWANPWVLPYFRWLLHPVHIPQDIQNIQNTISSQNLKSQTWLILPWHGYMSCRWTDYKIFPNMFDTRLYPNNVLSSKTVELGDIYDQDKSDINKNINQVLEQKKTDKLTRDINYIILLKHCANSDKYDFLYKDQNIAKIKNYTNFDIFILSGKYEK